MPGNCFLARSFVRRVRVPQKADTPPRETALAPPSWGRSFDDRPGGRAAQHHPGIVTSKNVSQPRPGAAVWNVESSIPLVFARRHLSFAVRGALSLPPYQTAGPPPTPAEA